MHTIYHFQHKKKIALNYPKSAGDGIFQGTQKRVRNSHGKRAISVRATEVLPVYIERSCSLCPLGVDPVLKRLRYPGKLTHSVYSIFEKNSRIRNNRCLQTHVPFRG